MKVLHQVSLLVALFLGIAATVFAAAETDGPLVVRGPVTIHVFWQEGCPYCASAKAEINALAADEPHIEVRSIELGRDIEADILFARTLRNFGYDQAAVPLVVIGTESFLGFRTGGHSAALYRDAVERCTIAACPDIVAELAAGVADGSPSTQSGSKAPSTPLSTGLLPDAVQLPLIGPVRPADLSLPALTILLAAIDGFNPCAMWVLVFLIGLLLGLKDEKRMWILGGAFLLATAAMYFAVMAVWLNLVLFLGAAAWVRILIGILAIGGGLYFLREYWTKPDAACHVTNPGRRQKLMNAFRSVVDDNRLLLSIVGMMMLAVLVNFVELLCSAGIPAVYTQVLALNDLSLAAHYTYIGLYIAVFMFDDIAIFTTAMFALRVAGLTSSYARYSHLIGGIILLAIGAIMLLRPELLSFG